MSALPVSDDWDFATPFQLSFDALRDLVAQRLGEPLPELPVDPRRRPRALAPVVEAPVRKAPPRFIEHAAPVVESGAPACASHARPEWFVEPQTRDEYEAAARVCRQACPRAADCLSDALSSGEEWGVWGGVYFTAGVPRTKFRRPHVHDDEPRIDAA